MILCPINGDWCDKYVFDEDWKLSCDCEFIKEGEEIVLNKFWNVVYEELKIEDITIDMLYK
jgi:hypothetical protein